MRRCRATCTILTGSPAGAVLPRRAPGVVATARDVSDSLSVLKEEGSPCNAEIAVRLSEVTPPAGVTTVLIGRDDDVADSVASGVLQAHSPLLLVPRAGPVPQGVPNELAGVRE